MFDAILRRRETLPKRRFGAGVAFALSIWAGLAVLAPRLRTDAPDAVRDVPVTFVRPPAAAPAPPPPPPLRAARPRTNAQPSPPLVQPLVAPTELPKEPPPAGEPEPAPEAAAPATPGGVEGGEAGGVPGGVVGGVLPASGGRLDFDDRMAAPVKLSGPDPQYTERALQRDVEGTMVVRCVVTTEGRVFGCRVLKGLPYMDRAVVEALEQRRYRPATLAGRPVEVSYDFKITLRLR